MSVINVLVKQIKGSGPPSLDAYYAQVWDLRELDYHRLPYGHVARDKFNSDWQDRLGDETDDLHLSLSLFFSCSRSYFPLAE